MAIAAGLNRGYDASRSNANEKVVQDACNACALTTSPSIDETPDRPSNLPTTFTVLIAARPACWGLEGGAVCHYADLLYVRRTQNASALFAVLKGVGGNSCGGSYRDDVGGVWYYYWILGSESDICGEIFLSCFRPSISNLYKFCFCLIYRVNWLAMAQKQSTR